MAPLLSLGLLLEWFRTLFAWSHLFYCGLNLLIILAEMGL